MNRFKNTSTLLQDMIITDILYLILGEIVIFGFLPNKKFYAVGFLVGVIISIISAIHMKITLEHSLHQLDKSAVKRAIFAYAVRMFTIAIILYGMFLTGIGDLLAGLIGMFALKLSAYLQFFTHEITKKIIKFINKKSNKNNK